jgi:hypothetical protein
LFETLAALAAPTPENSAASPVLSAAVSALAFIARARPVFLPRVVAVLATLHAAPLPHLYASQRASLDVTLKVHLLALARLDPSVDHHATIIPLLEVTSLILFCSKLQKKTQHNTTQHNTKAIHPINQPRPSHTLM